MYGAVLSVTDVFGSPIMTTLAELLYDTFLEYRPEADY